MKQIWIIHGGDSFSSDERYLEYLKTSSVDYERLKPSKKWRDWLIENMQNADILTPTMPNSANAKFDEWRIYFQKLIPFFTNDVQLVGHSLGAMFLAKYLESHPLPRKVKRVILIAGGYDDAAHDYGSFRLSSVKNLPESADEIHLFHSRDDFVVPFSELAKLRNDLPDAHVHVFDDRNHFLDSEFPELLELVKQK